jgi:hypothetical protein
MKQTAIDWLKEKLESNYGDPQYCELSWEELDRLFEYAKQIEKQQIVETADHFSLPSDKTTSSVLKKYNLSTIGEDYYNNIYNK